MKRAFGLTLCALAAAVLTCSDIGTPPEPSPGVFTVSADTLSVRLLQRDSVALTDTVVLSADLPDLLGSLSIAVTYGPGDSGWLTITPLFASGSQLPLRAAFAPGMAGGRHEAVVTVVSLVDTRVTCAFTVAYTVSQVPFFVLETSPILGYDTIVDAVTKASDVADGVKLRVEQAADTADSIKDVIVEWGDGTANYRRLNGAFPLGILYTIGHWFVVDTTLPAHGRGTLRAVVTTWNGDSADTIVPIHVLTKCEHMYCPPPNPADTGLTVSLHYNGPVYEGTAYSVELGMLPRTDHVIWIEDSSHTYVKTLLINRDIVWRTSAGTHLAHVPTWTASSGETDSAILARLAPDSLGSPADYDAITGASVTFNNPAKGDTTWVADTTISTVWDLTNAAGDTVLPGLYRFCAEVANIHKDTLAGGTEGPDSVLNECTCGTVDTRTGEVTAAWETLHILGLDAVSR